MATSVFAAGSSSVPRVSEVEAARVLARFRGPSGDNTLNAFQLRFAMTAVGMAPYEQRIVLDGDMYSIRVDAQKCAEKFSAYSEFEYERCTELLAALDSEDLSYWGQPIVFLTVVYRMVFADHRRQADHSLKQAWDLLHLFLILFFFCASTYVNVLDLDWDYNSEAHGLVNAYYAITVFFIIDIGLSTQLSTRSAQRMVLDPKEIISNKKMLLFIDVVAALPFDFILQSAGAWIPFMVFRCAKYIKIFRAIYLFEIVNTSIVTKGRLRFFYELKPLILGTYWVIILLQVSAVLHSMADIYHGDEVTGERHWPYFIESYIIVSAAFIGSPADILCYNDWERANVVLLMLGTLVFQGAVISKFSTLLLSTSVVDENLTHLRKLVSVMAHYHLPGTIQRTVLSYQFHDLNDHASLHMDGLRALPDPLLIQVQNYSKLSAVKQVPLFARLPPESQTILAKVLWRAEYAPQEAMVTIGEDGNEMFMITFGYVEVIIGTGAVVANLTQGDFFGELALFSATGKRMATVRALTFVDAWSLSRQHFIELCAMDDVFRKTISDEVARRGTPREEFDKAVEAEIIERKRRGPINSQVVDQEVQAERLAPPAENGSRSHRRSLFGNRRSTFGGELGTSLFPQPNAMQMSLRRDQSDEIGHLNNLKTVSFEVETNQEPRLVKASANNSTAPRSLRSLFGLGRKSLAGIQTEREMTRSTMQRPRSDSAEGRLAAFKAAMPSAMFVRSSIVFPTSNIPSKLTALEDNVTEAKRLVRETIDLLEDVRQMINPLNTGNR